MNSQMKGIQMNSQMKSPMNNIAEHSFDQSDLCSLCPIISELIVSALINLKTKLHKFD